MQVFNAIVRLQDNLNNEVSKRGLTVPEILVLRRIHGEGAVVQLKHVGGTVVDGAAERLRLEEIYGDGLASLSEDRKTSIEKMFGSEYSTLPEELKDYKGDLVNKMDDLEAYQEPEPYTDVPVSSVKAKSSKKDVKIPMGKNTKDPLSAVL